MQHTTSSNRLNPIFWIRNQKLIACKSCSSRLAIFSCVPFQTTRIWHLSQITIRVAARDATPPIDVPLVLTVYSLSGNHLFVWVMVVLEKKIFQKPLTRTQKVFLFIPFLSFLLIIQIFKLGLFRGVFLGTFRLVECGIKGQRVCGWDISCGKDIFDQEIDARLYVLHLDVLDSFLH